MGCDIHAHLEYYETHGDETRTLCYASDICLGRNYVLFNLLAGVRGIGGPVFPVRGMPQTPKLSFQTSEKYYTDTNENNEHISNPYWHTPSYLFKNELIEVRRKYLIDMIEYESTSYKGSKRKQALNLLKNSSGVELMKHVFPSIEYVPLNTTIAAMIAIENSGNHQSRFVFWFDS